MNLFKMCFDNMLISLKVILDLKERSPHKVAQVPEMWHLSGET